MRVLSFLQPRTVAQALVNKVLNTFRHKTERNAIFFVVIPNSKPSFISNIKNNMKKKIKAIGKKVVVILDTKKTHSEGGIEIPESSRPTEQWGIVYDVGNEVSGSIKDGDRVLVTHYQGTHLIVDGVSFVIVEDNKLMAKDTPE